MGGILRAVAGSVRRIAFPANAAREPVLMLQLQHVLHRYQEGDAEIAATFKALGVQPFGPDGGFDLGAVYDDLGAALDGVTDRAAFERHVAVLFAGLDDLGGGTRVP